jgi:cell division protein FtsL
MATVRVVRNEPDVRRSDPEEERSRHLRVVRPGARRRTSFKLTPKTGVTLTVLMFGALFGVAVSHALLIQSQIKLDEMDKDAADEQARYEQNRADVAELESPDRIIAAARDLGMVDPAETVWLTPDEAADAGVTDGATGSQATGSTGADAGADSPDTSYAEVKPYLGSTP